jgi:hypothetical protein
LAVKDRKDRCRRAAAPSTLPRAAAEDRSLDTDCDVRALERSRILHVNHPGEYGVRIRRLLDVEVGGLHPHETKVYVKLAAVMDFVFGYVACDVLSFLLDAERFYDQFEAVVGKRRQLLPETLVHGVECLQQLGFSAKSCCNEAGV